MNDWSKAIASVAVYAAATAGAYFTGNAIVCGRCWSSPYATRALWTGRPAWSVPVGIDPGRSSYRPVHAWSDARRRSSAIEDSL